MSRRRREKRLPATLAMAPLRKALRSIEIEDPTAAKIVVMSKWERGEISGLEAEQLIRGLGLEAA
jgi:hypothetical protein